MTMNGFNTAPTNEAGSQGLQTQFLQQQGYGPTQQQMLAPSGVPLHAQQQQQQQQMMQQAMHSINANDSAFWAMMPVASEGYNEWDEFFKAFNPGVASQNANYHPTAAVDLITALQDPNRLLSGFIAAASLVTAHVKHGQFTINFPIRSGDPYSSVEFCESDVLRQASWCWRVNKWHFRLSTFLHVLQELHCADIV